VKTAVGKGEHTGRKPYSRAPPPAAHWTVLGLSSTAVRTLWALVEFRTAAHAFLDGLFICVHFTSGVRLACFPPWLLCATAVAAAAGSQLSMLLEVSSNVSMLQLQVSSASYCSWQAGRQAKKAPLVCNS